MNPGIDPELEKILTMTTEELAAFAGMTPEELRLEGQKLRFNVMCRLQGTSEEPQGNA